MVITVEAYYESAYKAYDIAEESVSGFNKVLTAIENGFRKLINMFRKFAYRIMGLKHCKLPKQVNSQIKPLNIQCLNLFLQAKNKLDLDNKDTNSIDSDLKKLQNSDGYIKLMESKKEDYNEKDYEDANMKEIVGFMNKAADNITAAKNGLSKDKRDTDTKQDKIDVYHLMIHIANIHMRIASRVFSFGKIAQKTEEVPLEDSIEVTDKKDAKENKKEEEKSNSDDKEFGNRFKAPKMSKPVQIAKDHGYKLEYLGGCKVGEVKVKLIPLGMSEGDAHEQNKVIFNKPGESVKDLFKRLNWI